MSYKVLYRKYRPDSFDNVVGQDYTIKMLKNAIITGKNAHAYIFTGPRGTGKTSSAKLFAKALNCEHPIDGNPCGECASCKMFNENPDIIEIDAASNNGVDEIRELINNIKLVPSNSKFKVYIIDEVHMLTTSAFNALLLTLEEPPAHVVFILATTDIQNVPITILSRCQRFDFKPVSMEAMTNRLQYVCEKENIDIDDAAINEISLISAGGMRDALGMLDQLSSDNSKITLDRVSNYFGTVSVKNVDELLDALGNNDIDRFLEIFSNIKNSGNNYAVFVKKLIEELRKYAVDIKLGNKDYGLYYDQIYSLILDLNECLGNININIDPYSLIEIVLLKYVTGNKLGNNENTSINISKNESLVAKDAKITDKESYVGLKKEEAKDIVESRNEVVVDKVEVINSTPCFDIDIRINNCFAECSKEQKKIFSNTWVEFMNFLMKENRNLLGLLADTIILAASERTVLVQSKVDSTNSLINQQCVDLEKLFEKYSSSKVKFAALNTTKWAEETKKYSLNKKNNVEYKYVEENSTTEDNNQHNTESSDVEDIAKDIFGDFEIE